MTLGKKGLVGLVLAAALVAPASAHADTAGLVAAYGFEEASGATATDSSTAGNTGTLAGGPARSTSGKFGRALSFDGIDDRVNVNDANSLDLATGMTLEAWVNPSQANANWRTVLLKEQPAALAYALYSDEGAARPSVHAFTSREFDTRGTAAVPLNAWTHLTGTYDGATLRLFVNGSQVSSKAVTGALKSTAGALRIGGNAIWGEYFKGLIDEVRVYNRALTAAEIAADMAAPVVPADPAPSAPGSLTASVAGDDVTLSWTAATDNAGVTGYRVHRASTSGFTPSDANLIATTTGTSRLDADVPAGTYYYKLVAVDTAGQTGNPSNQASATVTGDTTPPTVAITGACPRTLSGDNAAIYGTRADDSGTSPQVDLYLDGTYFKRATSGGVGGWYAEWDTFFTPNGTYSLTAVARDAAGNVTTSASCDVTIANGAITIAITSPADGATLTGVVHVTAEARVGDQPFHGDVRLKLDGTNLTQLPAAQADWDTRFQASGTVHTLTAEARSFYPNDPPYKTTSIQVTVDHRPPVTPPTVPGDLVASVDDDDVTLNWTASTDDALRDYLVYRSSTPEFATDDSDNLIRWGVTGTSIVDGGRPAGTWYYKVIARDDDGNKSAPSNEASATVLPDTTPPALTIDDACPRSVERITRFAGAISDTRDSSPYISLRLDGAAIPAYAWQSSTAGAGQYAKDWDTWYTPNGTHTITVVARDAAGNEASVDCEVTVDNIPLTVGFTSLADGATVAGTVPVTAAQTSGAGCGCWIRIKIDGSTVALYASPPATFSWNTTGLANGSVHTLTAELLSNYLDEPPYTTTSIHVTTDQRDVTPPAAPVLWAGADSTGDVHLSIDADADVSVYRYHRSLTPDFTPTDANLIKTTASRTTTDGSRPTGTWYYRAVAVDAAGNRSAPSNEATAVVAPDLEAPMPVYIEDTSCGNGAAIAGTVTIKSRAGDNRWVKTLQLKLDGDDLGAPFVGTPGAVVATLTTSWDTRLTTNGLHVLTAVARDLDGNETTSPPCTYTVDNSAPPTVSVTAPTDGATVSGAASVRANADDDRAVRDVQFRLDGNALGAADTTMPYSISWDTTTAPNGSHTVTAVARDYDGNTTTSAPVTVTVSNAATGLVGAYGFEETSGTTAADGSGKGNAGTVSGATQSASGRFGRALSFDGVNDFVSVADASSLDLTTALTLEGWVKPTTVSGSWRTVLLKERPGGLAYALYAAADNGRPSANLWAGSGETEVRGASATSTTAWTHLAMTYDSVALRLYVNGTQVATTPLTAPVTVSTGALKIGGNAIWPEWFKGLIDEVRVYSRVLGPAEIAADRDTPVVP